MIDGFRHRGATYTSGDERDRPRARRRVREGAHPRPARAARDRQAGRPAPLLPGAHLRGRAGGRDGGARDDHARLQQLPRPHRRPAGQAGGPRRARDLRHRAHRLAPAERDHAAAPRARARARRVDGDRGGDRLHHRPPGERRLHRHDPRPRRHGDLRLGRPRLDPRRLHALRRQAAPLPPQPDGEAREDARSRGRRRRRRAGDRRRRLLDGGRPLRPAGDRRALQPLRRPADGRRGARASACSARAAPAPASSSGSSGEVDLRMGTFSKSLASCGGFIAGPAR